MLIYCDTMSLVHSALFRYSIGNVTRAFSGRFGSACTSVSHIDIGLSLHLGIM